MMTNEQRERLEILCGASCDELQALFAAYDEAQRDAMRYRHLRDHPTFTAGATILIATPPDYVAGDVTGESEYIDALIDAAIAATNA